MFGKAIETIKAKTGIDLDPAQILWEIKVKKEALSEMTVEITSRERERILDKVMEALLKGQELGDDEETIRERIRTRLFTQKNGDKLFVDNLKYINDVLAGSLPKSLDELTAFRSTLAKRLVSDAKGLSTSDSSSQRSDSGRSRSGSRRRGGRRSNQHQHQARPTNESASGEERSSPPKAASANAHQDKDSVAQKANTEGATPAAKQDVKAPEVSS